MLRGIINFAVENFVSPLFGSSVQLNPLNTVIYSGVIAGAAVLLISRIKESGFNLKRKFFLSSTPLLILTGFTLGMSNTSTELLIFEAPYSFILAGFLAAGILAVSLEIYRRDLAELHTVLFTLPLPGILLFLLVSTPATETLLALVSLVTFWSLTGYVIMRVTASDLMKVEFVYPVFAHYLDASTSYIAISEGAREKMFLGRIFVDVIGPGGIFVLKTLIIVPLTYYIFRNFEGEERIYPLYLITALGVVLSTRNFIGGL
jgi:uncharacterized membrane protein